MPAASVYKQVRTVGFAWLCAMMLFAGGCASLDRQEFKSTPHRPVTVLVEDQLTDELLWSFDVPTYHMLVLFTPAEGDVPLHWQSQDIPVSSMSWELWDLRRQWWELTTVSSGKVEIPGHPILVRSQLRERGELPDTLPTSPEGTDQGQPTDMELPQRAAEREADAAKDSASDSASDTAADAASDDGDSSDMQGDGDLIEPAGPEADDQPQ